MSPVFFVLSFFGVVYTDTMDSFQEHSNHNPAYKIVSGVKCETGLRSSGYSVAPTGRLFLKQVNNDGTVGPVCSD